MRFVLLGHINPNDEGFWSGTPANIARALRNAGHEVATIGPLLPHVTLWGRVKGRFYRHVSARVYLMNRDPALVRARAMQANQLLRDHAEADAIVVFYGPDAAYLEGLAPLILVNDATWAGLLDFYPGYERSNLARETVACGFELDRRALANCDRVIYSSCWAADSAIQHYGIDRPKVRVVPLGASLTAVPSDAAVAQWIASRLQDPCRLLFVGIDWWRKGGDIAVEVSRKLHETGLAVELIIVGCHPPSPVPPFVRSLGFLAKADPAQAAIIERVFQEASFFLMPSRADCSPLVFCEAAAYGLPVITTNVGGIPEIFGGRDWGKMLPPSAPPEEFARLIRAAHADSIGYERMAWAARRDFAARLTWDAFCRELVAVVASVKSERSGQSAIAG
jgi:glycosyltransferase involved in cell wall biosynthesis